MCFECERGSRFDDGLGKDESVKVVNYSKVDVGLWASGKHGYLRVLVDGARGQRVHPIGGEIGRQELLVNHDVADIGCGQRLQVDGQIGLGV